MNKDNAKDYLPLVQALAEGKTLQYVVLGKWFDLQDENLEHFRPAALRIKPEPVKGWYRVARFRQVPGLSHMALVQTERGESLTMGQPDFVEWLTDRIEYEVEA